MLAPGFTGQTEAEASRLINNKKGWENQSAIAEKLKGVRQLPDPFNGR
jgi:hypothetical protein